MSTDDNHTPAHLSAARLAEIRAVATAAPADLYAEPDPGATCDECGEHCGERGVILRTPGGGGALLVLSDDNDAATVAFHRDARAMVLVLLAHLDALTPRAVVDGEALGREARASHMDWSEDTASVWPFLTEKVRGDYCRTAIHVHAIGYAAGAVAMTGEGDDPGTEGAVLILMKRHDGELHEAHAAGRNEGEAERVRLAALLAAEHESAGVAIEGQQIEIARLTEECDAERVAVLERDATIARLTAELDATRADAATDRLLCQAATDHVRDREEMITLLREQVDERDASLRTETTMKEQVQDQLVEMRGKHREEWERAERLTAELAEAQAAVDAFRALPGYPHTEGVTPAMVKLRLEVNGAREERDAILHDIYALPGAREYSGERATIVRAIHSRATEGRQG